MYGEDKRGEKPNPQKASPGVTAASSDPRGAQRDGRKRTATSTRQKEHSYWKVLMFWTLSIMVATRCRHYFWKTCSTNVLLSYDRLNLTNNCACWLMLICRKVSFFGVSKHVRSVNQWCLCVQQQQQKNTHSCWVTPELQQSHLDFDVCRFWMNCKDSYMSCVMLSFQLNFRG